jgi:hypothetical protein
LSKPSPAYTIKSNSILIKTIKQIIKKKKSHLLTMPSASERAKAKYAAMLEQSKINNSSRK